MNITKDQAIKELSESIDMMRSYKVDEDESRLMQALRMAISALEQEPTDDATLKEIFCMGCEYKEQEPCETSTDEPMTMVYPTIFCDDTISREAVINAIYKMELSNWVKEDTEKIIRKLPPVQLSCDKCTMNGSGSKYCENCQLSIHRDRTVQDFVDKCRECGRIRKGGHWIKESPFMLSECSECGNKAFGYHGFDETRTDFCPNCGADMRGAE